MAVRSRWTLISVVIIATWRWMGMDIVYYSTGLTNIPKEMYEAAAVDGANSFQRTWYITIPLLRPVIVFVLTLNVRWLSAFHGTIHIMGRWSESSKQCTDSGGIAPQGIYPFRLGLCLRFGVSDGDHHLGYLCDQFKLVGFFDD